MGVIDSGHNSGSGFTTNEQVTASTLNAHVNNATFDSTAVDDNTIELYNSSGTIRLKDSASTTTGVTFGKMRHIASKKILGRESAGTGDIQEAYDFKDEDDMSSNSATGIASQQSIKAYIDNEISNLGPLVNNYVVFETTNGRNAEGTWRWHNYAEIAKNSTLSSFGAFDSDGCVFTFTSTGTYLVELDGRILDDDGTGSDTYGVGFCKGNGESSDTNTAISTTFWSRGGVTENNFDQHKAIPGVQDSATNTVLMVNLSGVIVVGDTSTDKLQVATYPISAATRTVWEGHGILKITKIA